MILLMLQTHQRIRLSKNTLTQITDTIRSCATQRSYAQTSRPIAPLQPHLSTRSILRSRYTDTTRASQQKRYRQAFNYQHYQRSQSLLRRWAQSRTFYYQLGGIGLAGGSYYYMHLEPVPVSHRMRFRNISFETEQGLGAQMFQETLSSLGSAILPETHPYTQMVKRVAERLIPHSGLQNENWEVFVVNQPETNAFVIPGGKIFVFTGMFDVCKTDDSLAAVIGHEIGHNVAHHAAERASQQSVLVLASLLLYALSGVDVGIQNWLLDFVFAKPGSRAQESEADYIGLLMMSEACYDPNAAVQMWAKMEELEKHGIPQWMSTHPSNHNRMEKIREWLPLAQDKAANAGCTSTAGQISDFWLHNRSAPQRKQQAVLA